MLSVEKLAAGYGKTQVLWDVSLSVGAGEIVLIAGANGAGKSTLLNSIAAVVRPWSGAISFEDERIDGQATPIVTAHGLCLVPEGGRVFPNLSVKDNLALGAYLVKTDAQRKESRDMVCELFPDLQAKLQKPARTLSGGQRQMLAVGIGLMSRPRMLMVDEPSSGLSPLMVEYLMEMICRIREAGVSVLLVEQNINAVLGIADRGYVLENGRVILEGSAEALKVDGYVKAAYLGL